MRNVLASIDHAIEELEQARQRLKRSGQEREAGRLCRAIEILQGISLEIEPEDEG